MNIEVNILKGEEPVSTFSEALDAQEGMSGLLAALKKAKNQTNQVLTELVEADKCVTSKQDLPKVTTEDNENEETDEVI